MLVFADHHLLKMSREQSINMSMFVGGQWRVREVRQVGGRGTFQAGMVTVNIDNRIRFKRVESRIKQKKKKNIIRCNAIQYNAMHFDDFSDQRKPKNKCV